MSSLTAARLLAIWERGAGQPAVFRALELLAAAFPDESPGSLADLSIGERDTRLLLLREQMFGVDLNSLADCPACGECVEMSFQAGDLVSQAKEHAHGAPLHFEWEGSQVSYRLLTSRDLFALRSSPQEPRRALARRCILSTGSEGRPFLPAELPEPLLEALAAQIAEADPLADIWFSLSCPSCGHQWQADFDVVAYFWSEIEAWAYRTLQEINCLARAYHWSEAEILRLSAWRRQLYISML